MHAPRRAIAAALVSLFAAHGAAFAQDFDELNTCLSGKLVDFTHNHGGDCRIWSPALAMRRDLYVYLPPGYRPDRTYPLLIWLHGFGGDERQFLRQVVVALDRAIVAGDMPPIIAAAPDGSVPRGWRPWCPGSWYINSSQGAWEDYITQDVVGFLESRFPIRSGRDAHVLAGWSMGGFGSYNIGMKHPDLFRSLVGIYANLNLRYVDCDGHWGTDFDPQRTAWLTDLKWRYILGAYPRYGFPVNAGTVFFPAWGRGRQAIERMSQENPVELLDRRDVRPGQYELFVAYGGKDEYNVDAQIDSFLYRAHQKAIDVWVRYNPEGHHATEYVNECMPDVLHALGDRLRRLLPDLEPGPEAVASRPWSVVGGP